MGPADHCMHLVLLSSCITMKIHISRHIDDIHIPMYQLGITLLTGNNCLYISMVQQSPLVHMYVHITSVEESVGIWENGCVCC